MKLTTANKIAKYLEQIIDIFNSGEGVKTLDEYSKRIEKLARQFLSDEEQNLFKGDMFEILAEVFFITYKADSSIGLSSYKSVNSIEDYGVDGIGINANNDKCAVQIKYRSNPRDLISYEDIAKTYTDGRLSHNLPLDKDDTIFIFTSTYEISHIVKKVFHKKVRAICRNIIKSKIDNNFNFWNRVDDLILKPLRT